MTKARLWTGGTAVVALLLLIAGWFLLVSPQRSEAADLRVQATAQQTTNDTIRLKTEQLKAQFASLPAREAQLAEIRQEMPKTPALPSLIRELSAAATSAGVTLTSVAPGQPTALAADAGAATTTAPVSTGIQSIDTTVIADGSYAELTLLLQKVQSSMRRAVLVEGVNLTQQAGTSGATAKLTMTLNTKVFILDTTAVASKPTATAPTTAPVS